MNNKTKYIILWIIIPINICSFIYFSTKIISIEKHLMLHLPLSSLKDTHKLSNTLCNLYLDTNTTYHSNTSIVKQESYSFYLLSLSTLSFFSLSSHQYDHQSEIELRKYYPLFNVTSKYTFILSKTNSLICQNDLFEENSKFDTEVNVILEIEACFIIKKIFLYKELLFYDKLLELFPNK